MYLRASQYYAILITYKPIQLHRVFFFSFLFPVYSIFRRTVDKKYIPDNIQNKFLADTIFQLEIPKSQEQTKSEVNYQQKCLSTDKDN